MSALCCAFFTGREKCGLWAKKPNIDGEKSRSDLVKNRYKGRAELANGGASVSLKYKLLFFAIRNAEITKQPAYETDNFGFAGGTYSFPSRSEVLSASSKTSASCSDACILC